MTTESYEYDDHASAIPVIQAGVALFDTYHYESLVMRSNRETDSLFPNYDVDEEIVKLAIAAVGNWRKFDSFAWHDQPEDHPELWTIFNTSHRDSTLIDLSNEKVIDATLQPYLDNDSPNIRVEHSRHWAVGYTDGYSIKVYQSNGKITPEFIAYAALVIRMESYPLLNEDDYCTMEYEATLENIEQAIHDVEYHNDLDIPDSIDRDSLSHQVFSYLWDNDQDELENSDDTGGYPSEESVLSALASFGYTPAIETED